MFSSDINFNEERSPAENLASFKKRSSTVAINLSFLSQASLLPIPIHSGFTVYPTSG